jgi:hypothetical protein
MGFKTLRAVSDHAVDSIKYSSYEATPKDRSHVGKSLLRSKDPLHYSFLSPSTPSSLRPRKSRIAFAIS